MLESSHISSPVREKLFNGMTIIVEQVPVEAVSLHLWVNIGSAVEYDDTIEPKINEAVKGAIKKNLNNDKGFPDLFKDLGDKLDFDQSMRNFNINPNTQIPNDQDKFLNFLYGNLPSEKNVNVY